ncbi:chemokine XC receptor 1-like [Latimeria chalumnae]|nr:PREDICTED: chemokine XC receptor 1-like [Latimeria chalumnae]|eukprot:XP_006004161.2 PREDICTED: chemokine XC receptor 1-like [Latimeria chalumnae]
MTTESYDDYYLNNDTQSHLCHLEEVFAFGGMLSSILYSVALLFSVVGNSLVLWILVKQENLKSVTNIFILNLAVSDLIFTFSLPFWAFYHLAEWLFGEILCKTMTAIFLIGFYSGIIFITIMTVHRYFIIVKPLSTLKSKETRYGILVCVIVWGISILASLPELLFTKAKPQNQGEHVTYICDHKSDFWRIVVTCQQNAFFLISLAVTVYCYFHILKALLKSKTQVKKRTVKLIFTIVIVFLLSWVPYNIVIFMKSLKVVTFANCERIKHLNYAFYICRKIAFSHCFLNPIFYAFVGVKFRRHLIKLCCSWYSGPGNVNGSVRSINRMTSHSGEAWLN